MEPLDQLISNEERKIDYLMQVRYQKGIQESPSGPGQYEPRVEDIDYGIERAYEQLAIYKIRKEMGF